MDDLSKDDLINTIPLRRIGDVNDVAIAVGYLVNASYVTGHVIDIDGGLHLN